MIAGIAGAVSKSQNAAEALDITSKAAELGSYISAMQSTLMELGRENEDLRGQLRAALDTSEIAKRMKHEEGVYWEYGDDGNRNGPFCSSCWDAERKRVHLTPYRQKGAYVCTLHPKFMVTTQDYQPTKLQGTRSG